VIDPESGEINPETGEIDPDTRKTVVILFKDIKNYLTDNFYLAMYVFATSRNTKTPAFSGGWANWPYWVVRVINIFTEEQNRWETKQLEDTKSKPKKK
jgi:hypothetical protein